MSVLDAAGLATSCIVARVFLDTNVLAYLFDSRAPTKQAKAEEILQSGHDLVLSTQVMLELFSVLTRKFDPPLSALEGEKVLSSLQRLDVIAADAELVLQAAKTCARHQLSIWDAMVLEAARFGGCAELWSEDLADGAEIRGVRVVNPFVS